MSAVSDTGSTGPLVLIVDDETDLRVMFRLLLEHSGYRVLEAQDGEAALAILERHGDHVVLIITDLMMPGMDWATATRGMRDRCPSTPVIISSGRPVLGEDEMAELGVVCFLSKPFSLDALLAACDAAVNHTTESLAGNGEQPAAPNRAALDHGVPGPQRAGCRSTDNGATTFTTVAQQGP